MTGMIKASKHTMASLVLLNGALVLLEPFPGPSHHGRSKCEVSGLSQERFTAFYSPSSDPHV